MMRFLKHPLFLSVLVIAALYVVFAYLMNPPLPQSLLVQYMVICVVAVLLVVSFDDATASRFAYPISALLGKPSLWPLRLATLLAVVAGATGLGYWSLRDNAAAPLELRTVHPAPPSGLKVYGKSYDLLKLRNPVRAEFEKGSEEYVEAVREGGELYYKNCVFCHGDRLDGQGHFGETFNPRPANFQDVGTIAQLQESYLFWRITTGGPGLPREGTPWASAMPVWHEMLDEDEVWKIITFLYDYTGHVPRSWEKEGAAPAEPAPKPTEPAATGELSEEAVDAIYMKRCSQCHGEDGDGAGPAAELLYPAPRDFTLALFKYKTTSADSEFPSDEDFRRTIRDGLPGTAMPGWKSLLGDAEIDGLIRKIKQFGEWDEEEIDYEPIEMGQKPEVTPELLALGRQKFEKACVQCHGEKGRGNITSGKKLKDDWGNRIWPRNLTRPETWRWTRTVEDIYQRISAGIPGTPMPEHTTTVSEEDRWAIASYVMTLRESATPLSRGDTVINAIRVDGDLPSAPDDPAWDSAPAMTFRLSPNIIKEPRLFYSLNDMVTVRALYNDSDVALRVDVDDRTYSVPGDELERRYALEDADGTRDAVAVQLPVALSGTSEKPAFRHGDPVNAVSMWYWSAPSADPAAPEQALILDASGPDKPPAPRADSSDLQATGAWKDGQWQVVFRRARETESPADITLEEGAYVPVAFADWDGLAGESGGRHSFTSWYWLRLEPRDDPVRLYGLSALFGLIAGALFLFAARGQRRRFA